jgi:hypothetical protein
MTKTRQLFAGLAVALAAWLTAGSAYAQIAHSWVSSGGSGTACTRAAPCGSLNAALSATAAGGVISVFDPFDFNVITTITKSVTIRAEGVDGGETFTPSVGVWINVSAGATDVVTLEGLHFNGLSAIQFASGGHLHVVRCVITNGSVSGDAGILFQPNSASKLSVTDTVISNFGSGTGGVNGNAFGIAADGSNSTAGINMTIANSMIGGNANDGIIATTPGGGAPIGVMVTNTESVNNGFGIRSIGPNVTVRVENSKVIGNGTGVTSLSGGGLVTFGNNVVQANGSNGGFTAAAELQ